MRIAVAWHPQLASRSWMSLDSDLKNLMKSARRLPQKKDWQLAHAQARFPLTPPSPHGRGRIVFQSSSNPQRLLLLQPERGFPSPQGRGWGEGEGSGRRSVDLK